MFFKTKFSTKFLAKNTSRKRGFTLIELLVVIAIIALLSTVVMAGLSSARQKSRDVKRLADMKAIQTALELYYSDNNGYPIATSWRSVCAPWGGYAPNNVMPGLIPTYLTTLPNDPMMVISSNVNCYLYISTASGDHYKFLDYNCTDCIIDKAPSFKDPRRNGSSACTIVEGTPAWAFWSGPPTMCF